MIVPIESARETVGEEGRRPTVLVTADTQVAGRRAFTHAVELFGPEHRYVVIGFLRDGDDDERVTAMIEIVARHGPTAGEPLVLSGDTARSVCDAALRWSAVAVIVGVDLESGERTSPSDALRVLRRSPCPVIMVAA